MLKGSYLITTQYILPSKLQNRFVRRKRICLQSSKHLFGKRIVPVGQFPESNFCGCRLHRSLPMPRWSSPSSPFFSIYAHNCMHCERALIRICYWVSFFCWYMGAKVCRLFSIPEDGTTQWLFGLVFFYFARKCFIRGSLRDDIERRTIFFLLKRLKTFLRELTSFVRDYGEEFRSRYLKGTSPPTHLVPL